MRSIRGFHKKMCLEDPVWQVSGRPTASPGRKSSHDTGQNNKRQRTEGGLGRTCLCPQYRLKEVMADDCTDRSLLCCEIIAASSAFHAGKPTISTLDNYARTRNIEFTI